METLFITHPSCRLHDMGEWHPESPLRLDAISDQLLSSGLGKFLIECDEVPEATRMQLERVHGAAYLDELARQSPSEGYFRIDPDTSMNPHTLNAALHAAGALVFAVDQVLQGRAQTAFCAVRPPGHHAMPNQAMGFCFLNNLAIGAAHALSQHALDRIAIIDFDVHHGNGTEAMFAGDDRVLMCSFFQHPFYPHRGDEPSSPNMLNIPVPAYTKGMDIREIISTYWLPALEAHRPQMIFISAGFDAHREDDLGQLGLVEADYVWITEQILRVADRHAQGRVVSTLEGGYNLSALGRSVVAHIKALAKL